MAKRILLFLLCAVVNAESLDDAVRALARAISARLTPSETAHITLRNMSTLSAADSARAQAALDRALRRRVRNPATIEIALTISENVKGFILVAEIHKGNDRMVEMTEFSPDPPPPSAVAALVLEKKLLWEQDAPILDLAMIGDRMLVLDTQGVAKYERRQRIESVAAAASPVRDPRGRLEIVGDNLAVYLPTATCRGAWKPALTLTCEPGSTEFTIDQRVVRFTPARNTLEGDDEFANWSGDSAAVSPVCAGRKIEASGIGDRTATDFIALYDVASSGPVRMSDPVEFPGPVTALWPGMAVARNLTTGKYAAYALNPDCGR